MRALAAEYFQGSSLMGWPILALALFIIVFAWAALRLVRRGGAAYDDLARMPLDDDRDGDKD